MSDILESSAPGAPAPSQPAGKGRSRARSGTGAGQAGQAGQGAAKSRGKPATRGGRQAPRPVHPLLLRLGELHPRLFGPRPRPLKLGVFEDLVAAHPELPADELKQALGQHVRSSRYLQAVAEGQPRCGLDGEPVEAAAPEHVLHAVMEMLRRRQARDPQAAHAWALGCLGQALQPVHAAGQDRADYLVQVRTQDPQALALVEEAWAELSAWAAKREALRRAFQASGQPVEAFADMYGLDLAVVKDALAG